jgi:1,4-dihydroxy-2-naphthoate octaprenyltransferase
LALIGFVIAVSYCARPIAFGYVGRGLGELGVFVAFGILPVMGSYATQAGSFSWSAALASLPPGLFTVSVLYNHHFTHPLADEAVGKRSPVVVLGEERARMLSPLLLAAAYGALVANVILGIFPLAALVGLATAPLIFRSCARLAVPSSCKESLAFLFAVVRTNVATGVLIIGALILGSWKPLRPDVSTSVGSRIPRQGFLRSPGLMSTCWEYRQKGQWLRGVSCSVGRTSFPQ